MTSLNTLQRAQLIERLLTCCGSSRWATQLSAMFPFRSREELQRASDLIWWSLTKDDYLEAFSHHPKIGASIESLRVKFQKTQHLSAAEQSGVRSASEDTLMALATGNVEYEKKFGYIFIVCATGKSAQEMLAMLQSRLPHQAEKEILIAAGEQAKITRIRLEKYSL